MQHYCIDMIAKVFRIGKSLALRLPEELHAREGEMWIEARGESWVVSRIKPPAAWPKDFFSRIRLSEAGLFERPPQGEHKDLPHPNSL